MTPATIIQEAQADGVNLALSSAGTIKATGEGVAVTRWLPIIRDSKAEIVDLLTRKQLIRGRGRSWEKGRMEVCQSCGDATGWRTAGKPLCPCCVPLDNPDEYRRRMLSYAGEMEKEAITGEEEKRESRLAVATAIRKAFEGDLPEFSFTVKRANRHTDDTRHGDKASLIDSTVDTKSKIPMLVERRRKKAPKEPLLPE